MLLMIASKFPNWPRKVVKTRACQQHTLITLTRGLSVLRGEKLGDLANGNRLTLVSVKAVSLTDVYCLVPRVSYLKVNLPSCG